MKPAGVPDAYFEWGTHPELMNQLDHFNGEVHLDYFGNIIGRLNGITKGECVKGARPTGKILKPTSCRQIDTSVFSAEAAENTKPANSMLWSVPRSPFSLFCAMPV